MMPKKFILIGDKDFDYEKLVVRLNKSDIQDYIKFLDKILKIKKIEMLYGRVFIVSEDLSKEELERLFNRNIREYHA